MENQENQLRKLRETVLVGGGLVALAWGITLLIQFPNIHPAIGVVLTTIGLPAIVYAILTGHR